MREIKSIRPYVIWSAFCAAAVIGLVVHGPRLLSYVGAATGYSDAKEQGDYAVIPITIGQVSLHALVADTPDKRITGLSYRDKLGSKQAMLFVFDDIAPHGIWMKSMKFPIDIIWVDSTMHVIHIEKDVSPDTFPKVFEPKSDSAFVIETVAGFTEKHHVEIGSELVLYR